MDKEKKKELLESLMYFSGILSVLVRESKKINHNSRNEYEEEYKKVKMLINEVKNLKEIS